MSHITEFLQKGAADVISKMPAEFTTRQFIWVFMDDYESDYIEMLLHAYTNEKTRIFHNLHAQIGTYLLAHAEELNILKTDERVVEMNPFGRKNETQLWLKR